jgi:hypothetical protein
VLFFTLPSVTSTQVFFTREKSESEEYASDSSPGCVIFWKITQWNKGNDNVFYQE